jgi:hypothetical protein
MHFIFPNRLSRSALLVGLWVHFGGWQGTESRALRSAGVGPLHVAGRITSASSPATTAGQLPPRTTKR